MFERFVHPERGTVARSPSRRTLFAEVSVGVCRQWIPSWGSQTEMTGHLSYVLALLRDCSTSQAALVQVAQMVAQGAIRPLLCLFEHSGMAGHENAEAARTGLVHGEPHSWEDKIKALQQGACLLMPGGEYTHKYKYKYKVHS